MNLLAALAKRQSKALCNQIVRYVGNRPARYASLVRIFLAGPYRITQHAAWPLSCCVENHPDLIRPHLKTLIRNLRKPGQHDAVRRNTLRLLQFVDIPVALQGEVADACFRLFQSPAEPIAVKVFSMSVLANIAAHQPELKHELRIIIEDQLPFGSAAFVSRARKILRQLN